MMGGNVTIIREQFSHMGRHSGYDMLCPFLEKNGVVLNHVWLEDFLQKNFFIERVVKSLWSLQSNRSPFYGQRNLWTELLTLKRSFLLRGVIHILYAENNLGLYSLPIIKNNNRLAVTVHQPFSWWNDCKINILQKFKAVDVVIVLSRYEQKVFGEMLGNERVKFIPHGVDTEFFCPPGDEEFERKFSCSTKRYLFVGQWLRDFETLFDLIEKVQSKGLDVAFDLVVPDLTRRSPVVEARLRKYEMLPQVERHQGVDDNALQKLYRQATLLMMPLNESTANNAILEAMACGLPIVTNHTNGLLDYVDATFARVFNPGETVAMVAACESISVDKVLQKRMSKAARKTAVESFSWGKIAETVSNVYFN